MTDLHKRLRFEDCDSKIVPNLGVFTNWSITLASTPSANPTQTHRIDAHAVEWWDLPEVFMLAAAGLGSLLQLQTPVILLLRAPYTASSTLERPSRLERSVSSPAVSKWDMFLLPWRIVSVMQTANIRCVFCGPDGVELRETDQILNYVKSAEVRFQSHRAQLLRTVWIAQSGQDFELSWKNANQSLHDAAERASLKDLPGGDRHRLVSLCSEFCDNVRLHAFPDNVPREARLSWIAARVGSIDPPANSDLGRVASRLRYAQSLEVMISDTGIGIVGSLASTGDLLDRCSPREELGLLLEAFRPGISSIVGRPDLRELYHHVARFRGRPETEIGMGLDRAREIVRVHSGLLEVRTGRCKVIFADKAERVAAETQPAVARNDLPFIPGTHIHMLLPTG